MRRNRKLQRHQVNPLPENEMIQTRDCNYNLGALFTLWRCTGGSYRVPRVHGCEDDYHVNWSKTSVSTPP